jgi:hypothetical protein
MLKRVDHDNDVADEVRTIVPSQIHAAATLGTDEYFFQTHYL